LFSKLRYKLNLLLNRYSADERSVANAVQ